MLNILLSVGGVLLVLLILLVIVISRRPSDFLTTRSTLIAAPAEVVFPFVNDLHQWEVWSPWAKIDPTMKQTYEGPPAGTGAGYSWVGNNKVGEGRMTITESRPNSLIRFKLEFRKPFQATNTAEFTFQAANNQTTVTWSMSGKSNFFFKFIGLFMDCDKMIGSQFEKGLADLKALAETAARK